VQGSHGSTVSELTVRHLAIQAGPVARKLKFRDVFTTLGNLFVFLTVLVGIRWRPQAPSLRLAAA